MTERNIDSLGRIVLPKSMLKDMGINNRTLMQIDRDGDKIVISPAQECCKWCHSTEDLIKGFPVCRSCAERVSDLLKLR